MLIKVLKIIELLLDVMLGLKSEYGIFLVTMILK